MAAAMWCRSDLRIFVSSHRQRFDPTAARGGAAYLPLPGFANFTPTGVGRYEIRLQLSTEMRSPMSGWG